MVGLKTFWITICTLFLFAACVPQTKQTECKSNEAFNASLRTCVPVVGGPSSFINISSFAPVSSITKYKDDYTTMTFEVMVSNPYNQSYSVAWERVFNGTSTPMCSNALTCSFPASLLGMTYGELGTHVLIAKIKDGNGTTVDSHNFEIRIVDLPKPVINTASLNPSSYAPGPYFPTDPRIQFSFQVKNNNATISAMDNYRVVWTVQKNGSAIYTESDSFTSFSPTGTNTAYLGASPTPYFNPATLGVGSYIVRAQVQNDVPGEIVAEQQWSVIIKQPSLTRVTNVSLPAPGVNVLAHNNVDYNDYPTESWVYSGIQPQFCIEVDDRDGTYPSDGQSLLVKFYLDGAGGDICTKRTPDTPGTQIVCLLDNDPCVGSLVSSNADTALQNSLKFTNPSSSAPLMHTVVARVFDEATSSEIETSNVINPSGLYPIKWNVLVNPVNTAPVMTFGNPSPNVTGCTVSGAYSRSNCTVNQGEAFTIRFNVTDDFYSPITDAGEFRWEVKLKSNASDIVTPPKITGCSKALGATTPAYSTTPGATGWECTLEVPHYTASGSLHPAGPFQVVATMEDSGSPVGGSQLQSQTLTWNLVVKETNNIVPNITLNPQQPLNSTSHISNSDNTVYYDPAGSNSAVELDTVTFRLAIRDPELDDFSYTIYRCGAGSSTSVCNAPVMLTSASYSRGSNPPVTLPFTDTVNTDPLLINAFLYQLPETLLLDTGNDVDTTTPTPVYFKIDVNDTPVSLTPSDRKTDSKIFTLYVRNKNDAPVIDTNGSVPAVNNSATAYPVMAGYPFTIFPGSITDPSVAPAEKQLQYQWFASGNGTTWTAVAPATNLTSRLVWTPDHSAPAEIQLKLCVGDQTQANPILNPATSGSNCSPSWYVAPKSYLVAPTPQSGEVADASLDSNGLAVWHDTLDNDPTVDVIYSAYIGDDKQIYVNKTVRDVTQNLNVTSFETVSFAAIDGPTAAIGDVTGLSLTGTRDSLYIAYGASLSSAPENLLPRIRRIDKSHGILTPSATDVGQKVNYPHKGKFGFSYLGTEVDITSCSTCSFTGATASSYATITLNTTPLTTDIIEINGISFIAGPPATTEEPFCTPSCSSANDAASNLAAKINSSIEANLQGITAVAASNNVRIYGQNEFDSILINTTIGNNGVGKIFVIGDYWFLPIINSSISGSSYNNITVISGSVDVKLQDAASNVSVSNILTNLGQVAAFDAQVTNSGSLVVAAIRGDISNAGRVRLARYAFDGTRTFAPFANPAISMVDIFGTKLFEEIKVAANTVGNNSIYVLAKERLSEGGEYNVGRYAADLGGVPSENLLNTRLVPTDDTSDFISDTLMTNPVLVAVPNSFDARIFFNSVGTPAGNNATRVARWRSDDTFTCGICAPVGFENTNSQIGVSNVVADVTIGTAGATANENQKDVAVVLTNYLTGSEYQPQLGLINLESETIQSTTVDNAGHLFRPPFAK